MNVYGDVEAVQKNENNRLDIRHDCHVSGHDVGGLPKIADLQAHNASDSTPCEFVGLLFSACMQ